MIKRIYATKLIGMSDEDVRLLEATERERAALQAKRIAAEYRVGVDGVLRRAEEVGERILRGGLATELRRLARIHGMSEEDAHARYNVNL